MADPVAETLRRAYPRLVAALTRGLGDMELARDAAHEAMARAVQRWPAYGLPADPLAWLVTVGRNHGIDHLRRTRREEPLPDGWVELAADDRESEPDAELFDDDLLRLLFTCCHPALGEVLQITLMLRVVLDFSTQEIAAALLTSREAIERRLSRAKLQLRDSGAAWVTPAGEALAQREATVLRAVYLLFNHGYSLRSDAEVHRQRLMDQAIHLARVLVRLFVNSGLARALLALLLLTAARSDARLDERGGFVPLDEQDRRCWNWPMIREGRAVLDAVIAARHPPNGYLIQAAIASLHDVQDGAQTDWLQIAELYSRLAAFDASPAVHINEAVARAHAGDAVRALSMLDTANSDSRLKDYQPLHAARAHVLARLGRTDDAAEAYAAAIALCDTAPERAWLAARAAALSNPVPGVPRSGTGEV